MEHSRSKLRQRLASAAFLAAMLLISARTCHTATASTEIRFLVGAAGAHLQELDAGLYEPGEPDQLAFFRRSFEAGSGREAGRWTVRSDEGMYRVAISLRGPRGTVRVDRAVQLQDGATVTIDLERDLERDQTAR